MTDAVSENRISRNLFLSNPFLLAAAFLIALVVFEYYFFFSSYPWLTFLRHWEAANYSRLLIFCGLSLGSTFLLFAFVWAAFSARAMLKPVYFLIFSIVVAVEYGYYFAFRRFSTLIDLATAMFTGVDLQMANEAMYAYINWLALIPIFCFGILLMVSRRTVRRDFAVLALSIAAFISCFAASTYFTSNQYYAPSFSNFARTVVSYPTGWYLGTVNGPPQGLVYATPRASPSYSSNGSATNNIVFIVDESVRGDRLSINGHTRPTTPTLDELSRKGSIANWGIAVSGTTCSHTSNPLLLTGLTELPDLRFEVYRWPTIFQYAVASGYKTHYFDAHTDVQWLGKASDIPTYGRWTKVSDLGEIPRYERDAEIARRVKAILETSTGNFIWVHKYGVHLRYENSFPNDLYGRSLDKSNAEYDLAQPGEALRDSYDQALAYNLESFFSTLFANGPTANTTYIYTSDHGQSLRDSGEVSSHCNDSRSAAIVPLMMIGEKIPSVDTQFKATHANIFATLLDLMNYPESEREFQYRKSLLKATASDSQPRFFYTEQLHLAQKHAFD